MPQEHSFRCTRRKRLLPSFRAALFVLLSGSSLFGPCCEAGGKVDPYDMLYDLLMTRYGPEGKSYAADENSPAIFPKSDFPFGDETYERLRTALDAFAALPQTRVEAYSDVQRALLQRHLWKVFDATQPGKLQRMAAAFPDGRFPTSRSHSDRREAMQPQIAALLRRLALTKDQIRALPDTLAATVELGGFYERPDPARLFRPFFPADLRSAESPWVCLGETDVSVPADIHSAKFQWRTVFLPFVRVPDGHGKPQEYFKKINRTAAFPQGTQFALIEQAFLISDTGEIVLSPLVSSVSLRAYLGVAVNKRTGRPRAEQCVAEFVLQPRRLMQGDAVMKALRQQDFRFESGNVQCLEGGIDDPFESREMAGFQRLDNCRRCHANSPPRDVKLGGLRTTRPPNLRVGNRETIVSATLSQKTNDISWKALCALWQDVSEN